MSVSSYLSNKLREKLGRDAAEDLVTWLVEERKQREELRTEVIELRQELRVGFAKLETSLTAQISGVKADLMKWSFVFWVGAVAAIAMVAGVVP